MVLSMYIFMASPMYAYVERLTRQRIEDGRMKNVSVLDGAEDSAGTPAADETAPPAAESAELRAAMAEASPVTAPAAYAQDAPAAETDIPALSVTVSDSGEKEIRETTIEGGLAIKNQTGYKTDIGELLLNGPGLTLPAGQPQILVIHTHSSEAYTPAGLDKYEASDDSRTEDTQYNIVRVGDELCAIFEGAGLNVIHDRGIYDYPSYTGSYTRSGQAIEDWLTKYPSIRMVIDVHRDALGENKLHEYWGFHRDGASLICRILFEEATDIDFYVGRAINPAHQNPELPITFNIKMNLVEELSACLKKMGKRVKVSYF